MTTDERTIRYQKGTYGAGVGPACSGDRFWDRFDIRGESECWEWRDGRTNRGYGRIAVGGKMDGAHRIAYSLAVGDPGVMEVLHRCDNPPCGNPAHLLLGTHADNMADMASKGRSVATAEFQELCRRGLHLMAETRKNYNGRSHCGVCRIKRQHQSRLALRG